MEGTATGGPDGCGTGQLGFFSHNTEIPKVLHFGGATIEFTTAEVGLRNGTYAADDVIPGGIGLSPDEIAVKVAPGTHILLRGDGMVLTASRAAVQPWSSVSFAGGLGSFDEGATGLVERTRSDGSLSISAPNDLGDYVVAFLPKWHTACLEGDGTAYSRIKVVTP